MALDTSFNKQRDDASGSSKWTRRRDIPLSILAWIGVVAVVLWVASHIVRSLLLLAIAALLAYALVPVVKLLERVMPRFLAMLIVYLIVLSAFSLLLYSIARTAIHQAVELRGFLTPRGNGQLAPLMQLLQSYGITQDQIIAARQLLVSHLESIASGALPLVSNPTWTQPWILAIIVLAYFLVVHAFEAHTVGPRIVGHAVGLHPGVSIFALVAGGELFGIWGALFAAPLAGLLQAVLAALWIEWRKNHPDHFTVEAH